MLEPRYGLQTVLPKEDMLSGHYFIGNYTARYFPKQVIPQETAGDLPEQVIPQDVILYVFALQVPILKMFYSENCPSGSHQFCGPIADTRALLVHIQ